MKRKILTTTYSPQIEGSYGIVCREIFNRIFKTGKYDIVSHAWFHVEPNYPVPWQVLPTMTKINPVNGNRELDTDDKFGEKSFEQVMNVVKPDIVWALGDFYMLQHIGKLKYKYPTVQFIGYVAVDGEPWHFGQTEAFKNFDLIVALTQFGSEVLSPLTGKPVSYIYHGVNTDVFKPQPGERQKILSSGACGPIKPDDFIIGWVGRNQFRKQVWKLWELMHYLVHGDYIICDDCGKVTLKEFDPQRGTSRTIGNLRMYRADYDYKTCWHCDSMMVQPGKPRSNVYAWSHMSPAQGDGWDQNQLGDLWQVRNKVLSTQGLTPVKGIDTNALSKLYNIFDVFYCMSGGEGFGIPVLEAMSTRVPVAYTNYSGHAEVAGDTGIPINCNWMAEMNSCYNRALADTADAVAKLVPYIDDKTKLKLLGDKAYERAIKITWDSVSKEWEDIFDRVSKPIVHSIGKLV